MFKALVSDFSRTLLSPKDEEYQGGLNALYKIASQEAKFDFWNHFTLHERLLDFYRTLKGDLIIALFTTESIPEDPAVREKLKNIFDEILRGDQCKLDKTEFESYLSVAEKIGVTPEETLYIDDKKENLYAAWQAGMNTIRFESEDQTIQDIQRALELRS